MSDEAKRKIAEYLSSRYHCRLATATPDGAPLAHTVSYASEGATLYFVSDRTTRKMQNIIKNSRVAYTVDENYADFTSIQGIQMEGIASIVSDQAEAERAKSILLSKFPFIADFPPNPNMVLVKITPARGIFVDNTVGIGHRDEVTY